MSETKKIIVQDPEHPECKSWATPVLCLNITRDDLGKEKVLHFDGTPKATLPVVGFRDNIINLPPQPTLEMEVPWDGQWREWGSYVQLDSAAETSSVSSGHQTKPTVKWIPRGRERYNPDGSAEIQFFYPED